MIRKTRARSPETHSNSSSLTLESPDRSNRPIAGFSLQTITEIASRFSLTHSSKVNLSFRDEIVDRSLRLRSRGSSADYLFARKPNHVLRDRQCCERHRRECSLGNLLRDLKAQLRNKATVKPSKLFARYMLFLLSNLISFTYTQTGTRLQAPPEYHETVV